MPKVQGAAPGQLTNSFSAILGCSELPFTDYINLQTIIIVVPLAVQRGIMGQDGQGLAG